ncbi:MAG: hypothetical protein GX108_05480 [Thermovirga sp.]|jgi:Spy/CpxP family protein refolding chaperone|nr:hypothetical protein [Thermovirga sp.]
MKKRAVLLALAAVLAIGSAAYAYGGPYGSFGAGMGFDGFCGPRMMHRGGYSRDRNVRKVDYPKEILDKMNELQRTRLEMRLALTQDEPDVNKAKLLFSKAQDIRNEISLWRFERYIESLKK